MPGIPVKLERWRPHKEEPFGSRRHERGEILEWIDVPEGAIGAIRSEHVHYGFNVALGHADGITRQQLLEFDDVVNDELLHHLSSYS
jgi:hypothetical protein